MEILLKYFPNLTQEQKEKFGLLKSLYSEWNERINVISRKDIDNIYERHILHSLSIAKIIQFEAKTTILDIGTGGGFPGIPLSIMFPEAQFTLSDSIGKKITVVNGIKEALNLTNVQGIHTRSELIKDKFDFVVSRAVTRLPVVVDWCKGKIKKEDRNALKNGLIYIKGGDFNDELAEIKYPFQIWDIPCWFEEEFFETKKIIHIAL